MAKRVHYLIEHDRYGLVGGRRCTDTETWIDAGPEPVSEVWRIVTIDGRNQSNLRIRGPKVDLTVESVAGYERHLVDEPA